MSISHIRVLSILAILLPLSITGADEPRSNLQTSIGLTVGEHGGYWMEENSVGTVVHGFGITLMGFSLDLKPKHGNDYYATLRSGFSASEEREGEFTSGASSYFFAGMKTPLKLGGRTIPLAVMSITSPRRSGNTFSIGSFHYYSKDLSLFNWILFELDIPISLSPIINTYVEEKSFPSFGVVSTPSIRMNIGRLGFGYDFHLLLEKAYREKENLRLLGWQLTGDWTFPVP